MLVVLVSTSAIACKQEQIAFVPEDDAGMVIPDMPEDMPPSQIDDGGDVPDATTTTGCASPCEGATPWCDEAQEVCVACRTAADCRDDLPQALASCEQNSCVYQCDQSVTSWQVANGQLIEEQGCTCEATEEVCDGQDNDCDGEVDELPSISCELALGVCLMASTSCTGDPNAYTAQCDASIYEALAAQRGERFDPEELESLRCDEQDNDCDGVTDEACCAPGTPAKPVRVANASLPDQIKLLEASAASPHQGQHVVAFLEDEQTLRMMEYDRHLNLVAQGTQRFPGKRIKVFEVMTTPTGYMIALGFHENANSSLRGASLRSMSFHDLAADSLPAAGTMSLLSTSKLYTPFAMMTHQDRVTQFGMVNDDDQILFALELAFDNDHSLSTCSSHFADIADRKDFCISRNFLDPDLAAFWANNIQISDEPQPHELVMTRREDRVALFWGLRSSNSPADTASVHVTTLDGTQWKTFDISHTQGNPFGYRSSPRLLQWLDDTEVGFIYRNEDIQTFSYLARLDAEATFTSVTAEQLPAIGSGDRYLGVGTLDEGRDGSFERLALLYKGSGVMNDDAVGLVMRDVAQLTTIQSAPTLLTVQRDDVNVRIPTGSSPFGLVALTTYADTGELELVAITHEGDMVCRP
jgi:hypothetical protein